MCQRHIVKWEKQGVSVDPQSVNPQSRPPELFNKDILSKGKNQGVSKTYCKNEKIRVCQRHIRKRTNQGVSKTCCTQEKIWVCQQTPRV